MLHLKKPNVKTNENCNKHSKSIMSLCQTKLSFTRWSDKLNLQMSLFWKAYDILPYIKTNKPSNMSLFETRNICVSFSWWWLLCTCVCFYCLANTGNVEHFAQVAVLRHCLLLGFKLIDDQGNGLDCLET